jgi:hypothetical protein
VKRSDLGRDRNGSSGIGPIMGGVLDTEFLEPMSTPISLYVDIWLGH